jgi:uncharacterized membrane protein YedE/YeeE
MDVLPLIDRFGEAGAALVVGLGLGLAFGVLAQRSAFCTRTAVLDLARGRGVGALAIWLAGFSTALIAVQAMLSTGAINLSETRFFANAQSLSGALIGGALFGIGMAMTRGCVSRLVVLAGSGNLRALVSILVVALAGLATLDGFLVPLRDPVSAWWSTAAIGGNDLLAHLRLPHFAGLVSGAVLALAALAIVVAGRASAWRVVGGAGVGLTVAAGWYLSHTLSALLFDPIPVESLSYIRPLSVTVASMPDPLARVGIEQGLILGTLAGAFFAAIVSRSFRIQTFAEPGVPSIPRYVSGASLMGFGGVLAGGCTVGAGLSGGSILAVSALVALAAMALGAIAADRVLDR